MKNSTVGMGLAVRMKIVIHLAPDRNYEIGGWCSPCGGGRRFLWPGSDIPGAPDGLDRPGGHKQSDPPDERHLGLPEGLSGRTLPVHQVEML